MKENSTELKMDLGAKQGDCTKFEDGTYTSKVETVDKCSRKDNSIIYAVQSVDLNCPSVLSSPADSGWRVGMSGAPILGGVSTTDGNFLQGPSHQHGLCGSTASQQFSDLQQGTELRL